VFLALVLLARFVVRRAGLKDPLGRTS